jgi:hypothetical protein
MRISMEDSDSAFAPIGREIKRKFLIVEESGVGSLNDAATRAPIALVLIYAASGAV